MTHDELCGLSCPCSIHYTCGNMQWRIALHMHWDIALNGCECMVEKSTLRLVFDWAGLVKWDEVQQSCMVE